MRLNRRRTKKLVVAFHFQFSNQTAWRCDKCRLQGLEYKRRCGFITHVSDEQQRIVWARGNVQLDSCPKSYVTGDSLAWLEEFNVRQVFGFDAIENLSARAIDAFCILKQQAIAERDSEQQRT